MDWGSAVQCSAGVSACSEPCSTMHGVGMQLTNIHSCAVMHAGGDSRPGGTSEEHLLDGTRVSGET